MNELARIKIDTNRQIVLYMHQKIWRTQCVSHIAIIDISGLLRHEAVHIYTED